MSGSLTTVCQNYVHSHWQVSLRMPTFLFSWEMIIGYFLPGCIFGKHILTQACFDPPRLQKRKKHGFMSISGNLPVSSKSLNHFRCWRENSLFSQIDSHIFIFSLNFMQLCTMLFRNLKVNVTSFSCDYYIICVI